MRSFSFATVAASIVTKATLTVNEVELYWSDVQNAKELIGKDGDAHFNMSNKEAEGRERRSFAVNTGNILKSTSANEMFEENDVVFINRTNKFRTVAALSECVKIAKENMRREI